ncbi:MAG: sulfatase [Verrucomicrobia bacterium]|nr:MAG: sulfatase [Verrucomicrobiota bacterium]
MNCTHINFAMNRREFFGRFAFGLGGAALFGLLNRDAFGAAPVKLENPFKGILSAPHFPPKANRIIYLFMAGGPSQLDLFDYKPALSEHNGEDLPASVRMGQRLTGMTGYQATLPMAGSIFKFAQHGQSGAWVSDLMPWTAKLVDELCFIKSMHTEAINHDPAITFFQTGSQLAGRPSMGAWLSYGLGSANENLPAFVVLISKDRIDQPLYARLWGNGFLPSLHQGVQFRSGKDPVLFLQNPDGVSAGSRRKMLDRLAELEALQFQDLGDPEINARIAQYEMAYRMQTSVPEVMDISQEPDSTFALYGDEAKNPGTFAANCLLARRMAERNVRFIQLYHPGWDHHGNLPNGIRRQAKDVDQACYALVTDLKQCGLLDDTLVVWGGEFGRTNYSQGKLTKDDYGRDHHPRCFTVWMAGAGIKPGVTYGATDDYGYNVAENPVHVFDLQATILQQLGIDHTRLIFRFQGRDYRLTDVAGEVVKGVLV